MMMMMMMTTLRPWSFV